MRQMPTMMSSVAAMVPDKQKQAGMNVSAPAMKKVNIQCLQEWRSDYKK